MAAQSTDPAPGSLFTQTPEGWLPGDVARGPWTPDALHGGPVAALVVRQAELALSGLNAEAQDVPPWVSVGLSVELLRPVPVAPLQATVELTRTGRSVRTAEVTVSAQARVVATGRLTSLRTLPAKADPALERTDTALAVTDPESNPPPGPGAAQAPTPPPVGTYRAFHNAGAELRFVEGRFDRAGPAGVWVRLAVPVVAGEVPSPMQRAAAAADFGNGVSSVLPFERYQFVNPDLAVSCWRPVAGEWVCLQARTWLGAPGVGTAESALFDQSGRLGRAVQSLVVAPRPA